MQMMSYDGLLDINVPFAFPIVLVHKTMVENSRTISSALV